MIGETIKDFRLTKRLGRGGMGEVWAAEQQIVKTRVAIKLLLEEISTDKQHVQRFFNEAIAVGRIKHAGITKIYDVGFHNGRAFLIMEFLDGEPLAARIARTGRLLIGQTAEIGRQIASILEATHTEGITHRDLKPDNIFLVPDAELASKERVKILDFGIAKLHGTGATGMTATGGTMGTPAYMAPEQWNDAAKADARADAYSLGCLTFEMLCGRPPFVVNSIGEACTKHLTVAPPRAGSLAPGIPGELDQIIDRMLAKAPADRPAMMEIGRAFAAAASIASSGVEPTLLPQPTLVRPISTPPSPADTTLGGAASSRPTEAPRSSKKPLWVVGSGVVAIGTVIAVVVTRPGKPDEQTREAVQPTPPPTPAPADASVPPEKPASPNPWVRIDPPTKPYSLGVADGAAAGVIGFRAARGVVTPSRPFEIQQHEVTWRELEPWLLKTGTAIDYPSWARDPKTRQSLPVAGVPWTDAQAYCQSLDGASLPTEEQWEYAARGPDRRANPWGSDPFDRMMTRAYAGADAVPSPVMTSPQDQAPNDGGRIYDLVGNVQEWTLGLWRDDRPGSSEDVQTGQTTVRAIRGFPLGEAPPAAVQPDGAAYRERLCATGPCVAKTKPLLARIGFRCARWLDK